MDIDQARTFLAIAAHGSFLEAAKRLHVRKNGQVYDGIPAFIALWQDMPRYRWLARVVRNVAAQVKRTEARRVVHENAPPRRTLLARAPA